MAQTTAALIGGAVGMGASVASAIGAKKQANDANDKAKIAQENLQNLQNSRQKIINPYENLSNEYANLGVATGAAEMQAEEADIALANTLDTLRATGSGAGGATALAQAALKSKQGVSANLEQQEVANEKLRAQGQMSVNQLKAEGEKFKFQSQEQRETIELDRAQGLIDKHETQANASQAAMWGAIGNMGNAAMQTGLNVSRMKTGTMDDGSGYDPSSALGKAWDTMESGGGGPAAQGYYANYDAFATWANDPSNNYTPPKTP